MIVKEKTFDEERALYGVHGAQVIGCKFDGPADGESALKESEDITVENCFFNLRYPFWHVDDARIMHCELTENCRAALWYDRNVTLRGCKMHGIKALRECRGITLEDNDILSREFGWRSSGISIRSCTLDSEYPFFECRELEIAGLKMKAKYSFQYVEEAILRDCELDTKDAFWHSKNVTVVNSTVKGEYLGWYSENLRLVRCRIIGTQPLCYCRGLVLEDCTMECCDLAFERSEVQASIRGGVDSVKNPLCGSIPADSIGQTILEPAYIDPTRTVITVR